LRVIVPPPFCWVAGGALLVAGGCEVLGCEVVAGVVAREVVLGGTVMVVVTSTVDDRGDAVVDRPLVVVAGGDVVVVRAVEVADDVPAADVPAAVSSSPGTVTVGPVGTATALDDTGGATDGVGSAVPVAPQPTRSGSTAAATASRLTTGFRARMRPQCQSDADRPCQYVGESGTSRLARAVTPCEETPMQPGMPDLSQIVLKAQQMQAAVERAKESLAETEIAGSAGGGLVTALVSGDGELRAVTISPDAVDLDDLETLGDLVVAAVRDASRQAKEMGEQLMAGATGGFDLESLGLGGFGLPQPPSPRGSNQPGSLPGPGA